MENNLNRAGEHIASCTSDDVCEMVQCEMCIKEVPASVAQNFEGVDYVHHFCGLECLGLWRENSKVKDTGGIKRP